MCDRLAAAKPAATEPAAVTTAAVSAAALPAAAEPAALTTAAVEYEMNDDQLPDCKVVTGHGGTGKWTRKKAFSFLRHVRSRRCTSPLDARATCCGCASDSGSESEDSVADSDDDAASAANWEAFESQANARVLQLVIDGVERMHADASLDGHQRALGVLQHVAHGIPDAFRSCTIASCTIALCTIASGL